MLQLNTPERKRIIPQRDMSKNRPRSGLPTAISICVFVNLLFYSMALTVELSFLPHMVKYFGVSELNTGYYAGIVASSVFVGRLCFSLFWGYLTDSVGKKISSLLTGVFLAITSLGFGFSQNFYWATISRFLEGCCMGQIVISKAIMADICDEKNIGYGMSIVLTAVSAGLVIGPTMAGFLVFPNRKYPDIFPADNIFSRFGILLPNLIISCGVGIGILFTFFFMPSERRKDSLSQPHASHSSSLYRSIGNNSVADDHKNKEETVTVSVFNVVSSSSKDGGQDTQTYRHSHNLCERIRQSKIVEVLKIKECLISCFLLGAASFVDIAFLEVFPVLAATEPKYKGLGFDTSEIGISLMVVSTLLLVLQITAFPKLHKKLGCRNALIGSNLCLTLLLPMLPAVAGIRDKTALWTCLFLLLFLVLSCVFMSKLSINILISNSVTPDLLGSANGVGILFASFGRLIAPLLSGSLYAWSLTNIKGVRGNEQALGFPFNQFFAFYVLSVSTVLLAVFTSALPPSMERKKSK